MIWRDANSCYCNWRVHSGGLGLVVMMKFKDGIEVVLKNAGDWIYSHGPFLTTYEVYSYEMSWWYFMLFLGVLKISLWDFMPFGPRPKHSCFKIVEGLWLVTRRWCKGMHESVNSGERKGLMGNMLRRGESSWLCMKFDFAFFAGQCVFIRVLATSYLA